MDRGRCELQGHTERHTEREVGVGGHGAEQEVGMGIGGRRRMEEDVKERSEK